MTESQQHTLIAFGTALDKLRQDISTMAEMTERNLDNAIKGMFERDDELCNGVIVDDEAVDQFEKQVDKDGVELLIRFQPVATDLRQIVSAMRVSANLERIADQAVNIARKARKLNGVPALSEISLLEPMVTQGIRLFKDSIQAYSNCDVALATELKPRDKVLDQMNAEIALKLTDAMTRNPMRIADYLNMMFVARHLERVGDHATNIAEDAVYLAAAEDIRHLPARPPVVEGADREKAY